MGLLEGIVGSIFGSDSERTAADHAWDRSDAGSRESRSWQQWMSSTAHQREVDDLKAAGLNPILSANGGASTPAGATASGPKAGSMANSGDFIGTMATTALDAQRVKNEVATGASTRGLQTAQGAAATAGAVRDSATAKEAATRTKVLDTQMGALKEQAERDKERAKYDREFMKYDEWSKRLDQGLGIVNSAKDVVKPWGRSGAKPNNMPNGMVIDRNTGEILRD